MSTTKCEYYLYKKRVIWSASWIRTAEDGHLTDGHRPQRPRAIVRLHVHLRLGREKQLDHLREAVACRRVQRGPASVRSPACGCASGHLPYKARYQVVGVDVCYKAFFIRCMFDRDWPKSTSPIIVSSLSQPCRYNKSNLLNPLNSLTQSAQTYSALMRHIDTACRESRFKTCRMCSSSIFWAEGYREYMAKPCVKSMAKENEHHITTVSGDRRLASPRSWEMHRVPRMVCLESFLKGLKLSYFLQLSKLEVKE